MTSIDSEISTKKKQKEFDKSGKTEVGSSDDEEAVRTKTSKKSSKKETSATNTGDSETVESTSKSKKKTTESSEDKWKKKMAFLYEDGNDPGNDKDEEPVEEAP